MTATNNKSFTHAGVSRLNGEFKVRFANDAMRVKVLAKNGHTDIDLVELREPMTKEAAIDYLLEINFANGNAEIQATLDAAKAGKEPKPAKAKKADAAADAATATTEAAAATDEAATTEATAEAAADTATADAAADEAVSENIDAAVAQRELEDAPY